MDIGDIKQQIEFLTNKVAALEFKVLELQKNQLPRKTKGSVEQSSGSKVWAAYYAAFMQRYNIPPIRNAKVNRQCQDIANRLGLPAATEVVAFFLTLNDQRWIRFHHPIGDLLQSCESVHAMWRKGKMVTVTEARQQSDQSAQLDASRSYLDRKHGKK